MSVYDEAWARVEQATKAWGHRLGITNVTHRRIDTVADHPYEGVVAETKGAWEYRQASILWYVPNVCTVDDPELERIVVHEFCHVLMAPMESLVTLQKHYKTCEYAVQRVADAILRSANWDR